MNGRNINTKHSLKQKTMFKVETSSNLKLNIKHNFSQSTIYFFSLKSLLDKNDHENFFSSLELYLPDFKDKYPEFLLSVYQCWLLLYKTLKMTTEYDHFFAKYIIPLCLQYPNLMHTLKTKQLYSYLGNSNMSIKNYPQFKEIVEKYINKILIFINSLIESHLHHYSNKKSENVQNKINLEALILIDIEKQIVNLFQIENPVEYFLGKKTHSSYEFESHCFYSNQSESIYNPLNCLIEIPSNNFENCSVSTNSTTYKNDPNSNYNMYSKVSMQKKEKEKARKNCKKENPLLKDFNPKFLKKENIDKKILRRFRAYIKEVIIKTPYLFVNYDTIFWNDFAEITLLPPMKYTELSNKVIEFKSFNTKYYRWLFSKNGAVELFNAFAREQGDDFLNSLLDNNKQKREKEKDIKIKLKQYLFQIPELYSQCKAITCINTEESVSTCSVERNEFENDSNEKEEKCNEYHNVFDIELIPYNTDCQQFSEQEKYFECQENQSINYNFQEQLNDDLMWMIDQIKDNNTEYIYHSNC